MPLLKAALVGLDPLRPSSVVVFQYNPANFKRKITPQAAGSRASQGEALRLKGAPEETIDLVADLDATQQLVPGNRFLPSAGLYPTLSALELLAYPRPTTVVANDLLANVGLIEVIPPEAPLTLLVWNAARVLPVRLTTLTVEEQMFDSRLNPIQAKVSISLRVLNYDDLGLGSTGGSLFLAHHIIKQALGLIGSAGSVARVLGI